MSRITLPTSQQPIVDRDGAPSATMQRLLDSITRRLNAAAALDPNTATPEDIVRALGGE